MKNLIVIADLAGGKDTALQRALEIRACNGARITFLGFAHTEVEDASDLEGTGVTVEQVRTAALDSRQKELQDVLGRLKVKADDVTCELIWSKDVVGETIEYCKAQQADVLIKSGHRSETWLYTSTDWQLFRQSPVPVMITAGKSWRKKARVLAAVDLAAAAKIKQKLNDRIVEEAKSVSEVLGDELHIAYAVVVPQPLVDLDVVNPRKYFAQKKKKLEPVVEEFCDRHAINPDHVHLKLGAPERIIPSVANSINADLVVAGTIGRKGVKGKLIGNTAEAILGKLHADILAVRP